MSRLRTNEVVEFRQIESFELIDALWAIYKTIGDLEEETPFAQGLSRVQFDAAIADESAIKLVIFDSVLKTDPIAFALVSSKPDEVHWLSGRFFARYGRRNIAMRYIVGAASKKVKTGSLLLNRLIDYLCDTLPDDGIVFFDYSDTSHASMMRFAARMGKRNGMVVQEVDRMVFCSAERKNTT